MEFRLRESISVCHMPLRVEHVDSIGYDGNMQAAYMLGIVPYSADLGEPAVKRRPFHHCHFPIGTIGIGITSKANYYKYIPTRGQPGRSDDRARSIPAGRAALRTRYYVYSYCPSYE